MGEKFAANPVTGTGSMAVPIFTSPGRSGFGPQLSLSYDSGAGNGPFGFGWTLTLPAVTRKTDKGLPRYQDAEESDVFILSGAEDLAPVLVKNGDKWERETVLPRTVGGCAYRIQRYRPRIEGLFARIERWTNPADPTDSFWRSISKDNVTTWYGKTDESRIVDPANPTRIFSWLICESHDDKGNVIVYIYEKENPDNIDLAQTNERNRTNQTRSANRYLKRIRYGNHTPYFPKLIASAPWPTAPGVGHWFFEMVFDYGEHDPAKPMPEEPGRKWTVRNDPFSSFRAGFEVRTYRLCQRALMFHHFQAEREVGNDCLVRSTDFTYTYEKEPADPRNPIYSFLLSVTQRGYKRQGGGYLSKALPSLEFAYTEPNIDETVREVDVESMENLPYGLDAAHYEWVDLDGEGLSGVMTEQGGSWFYKRNLSPLSRKRGLTPVARLSPVERVGRQPALVGAVESRPQFLDLAADGQLDLVELDSPTPGFYERTEDENWESLTSFTSLPSLDWKNPNLRFVDLTGDGHTDILISEDEVFCWHPSLAEAGFGPRENIRKTLDEEKGPQLIFAERTQSIYLADMSGDGLTDLVRIRNGEVCYWPNLGYGRFGAKVTMDNAPWFDAPDLFDQQRIRLADIDGSGVTDIIYLGRSELQIYFNQSGNSWGTVRRLAAFPAVDNLSFVQVTDLLGNGTACLVWSSLLPNDARQPMRYIDLMGDKPHLLVRTTNNMGAETEVQYAPSTKFYLQDRIAGRPWVTRVPFPVHVVERVESRDLVSNTKLVTTYRYRHGYFDGTEREFRGFAYVEQRDAETLIDQFDLPPIVTKTWFHTGAYLAGDKLEAYFKDPNNVEYFTGDSQATFLPDTELPSDLPTEEILEAYRALKGSVLRQEVYAEDGTAQANLPYSISERSYQLRRLQPRGPNRHAVFFSHASEIIDYHYERHPADPRIAHALTLEVDELGNVTKSAAVGYGRRRPNPDLRPDEQRSQTQPLITYTEATVINKRSETDWYRIGVPSEVRTYELTGFLPARGHYFSITDFVNPTRPLVELRFDRDLDYEQSTTSGRERRLIEHVRALYRTDDLRALLPLGQLESLALPGESYKLAFTPGLLDVFQPRVTRAQLTALLTGIEGQYRDLDGNGQLWIPSGLVFYDDAANPLNPAATAAQELTQALNHFFLPRKYTDPFGHSSTVDFDQPNDLVVVNTTDAVQNTVTASHDYRVLQPRLIADPNGNRSEARFDALGMVVGTVMMGKASGPVEGDSFTRFESDLTATEIKDFFDAVNPRSLAVNHLGTATTRIIYDLDRVPVCAASVMRERHVSDPDPSGETKVQLSFVYSDGFGREAQTKIQAEPGPLDPSDPASPLLNPRWVGTGTKIYNNKGKPVRQYEPFFSPTHRFGIEQHGVSSTLFYDPVERVVATLHPNNTYEKTVFDSWQQKTYDVNDTVRFNPKTDKDAGSLFTRLPDADYLPTWHQERISKPSGDPDRQAAEKAAVHADTPAIAHFDTLGRTFLTIAHNRFKRRDTPPADPPTEEFYRTRVELDIEGNQRAVIDARDRAVMRDDYDMLSTQIHSISTDAGERWMLNNAAGKPIRAWDSRDHAIRTTYDELQRPTGLFVKTATNPELLVERTVYGEGQGPATNHRGRIFQHFDAAGIASNIEYDFKGNPLESSRQLTTEYKNQINWNSTPMLADRFTTKTSFDALNRPIELLSPHNVATPASSIRPIYNEANLLNEVRVRLRGATTETVFVRNIDYNAKGQRTRIEYGNGAVTSYDYERETFRLLRLLTIRPSFGEDDSQSAQDLRYTYDPAGNITHIQDNADIQNVVYFRNQRVDPSADYNYDAIYRLLDATGREHLGQTGGVRNTPRRLDHDDSIRMKQPHPGDGNAMGRYSQEYFYDEVGNILAMRHRGTDPRHAGWKRCYQYAVDSNRLLSTGDPNDPRNPDSPCALHFAPTPVFPERYEYDAHSNMIRMPHLPLMGWDYRDQLQVSSPQMVTSGTPETTYYVYDGAGQRVHKVTERQTSAGATPARKDERIYLGGFEIYRQYAGPAVSLERETLHIMDDKQRIALVETLTIENSRRLSTPVVLQRYQFSNHLGSASLELDEQGEVISYEEYYPYGNTSSQAVSRSINAAAKRYRYTGKERDEETGLYYHGARYYSPWLGRWVSCDPQAVSTLNLFSYVEGNPIRFTDPDGRDKQDTSFWGAAKFYGGALVGGIVGTAEHIPTVQVFVMDYRIVKAAVTSDRVEDVPKNVYNATIGPTVTSVKKGYEESGVDGAVYELSPVKTAVEGYKGAYRNLEQGNGFEAGRSLAGGYRGAADTVVAIDAAVSTSKVVAPNKTENVAAPQSEPVPTKTEPANPSPSQANPTVGPGNSKVDALLAARAQAALKLLNRLNPLVQELNDRLANAVRQGNRAFLEKYLTSKEGSVARVDRLLDQSGSKGLRAADYGKALENMLADAIAADSELSQELRFTGNTPTYGLRGKPDFNITGGPLEGGGYVELTTENGLGPHGARTYGERQTLHLNYQRPADLGF
jgi:RHS repeat-associated protein